MSRKLIGLLVAVVAGVDVLAATASAAREAIPARCRVDRPDPADTYSRRPLLQGHAGDDHEQYGAGGERAPVPAPRAIASSLSGEGRAEVDLPPCE